METWNQFFAHPFNWSYTGEDLYAKAVRRFCKLLTIQTNQMDSKFLTSQLLLMHSIAENYIKLVPTTDWKLLLELVTRSDDYIKNIIQMETGPNRLKKAREAYACFLNTFY
jgi:hypothetical protein